MVVRLAAWMLIGLCGLGWVGVAFGQAGDAPVTPERLWAPDETITTGEIPCPDCGRLQPDDRSLAEHFRQFSRNVVRDFKRNNCWPQPFVRPDREAVRRPFDMQVRIAWERQNLLVDSHFFDDGNLSPAGENKIRRILTEAPMQHRAVYVRRAATRAETERRLDVAREFAVRFAPEGTVPLVAESTAMQASWSPSQVAAAAGGLAGAAALPAAGGATSAGASE